MILQSLFSCFTPWQIWQKIFENEFITILPFLLLPLLPLPPCLLSLQSFLISLPFHQHPSFPFLFSILLLFLLIPSILLFPFLLLSNHELIIHGCIMYLLLLAIHQLQVHQSHNSQ
eukprot:NODE_434_length_7483_cov_0.351165.p6 type:complete len:116 gc:universal NODE_434_length_7483_cov_0.351165:4884-4537(-)